MRSPTDKGTTADRRQAERRSAQSGAVKGERRVAEKRGTVHAMADALEDILKWERASERALRVAQASTPDVTN